jgi:hypothetical protein
MQNDLLMSPPSGVEGNLKDDYPVSLAQRR